VLPVAAVAGVAVDARAVARQIDEHGVAVRGGADAQPVQLAGPDHIGEGHAGLCGEPIDEPIVGYGPFVMNTSAEIRQAIADYESGKMGHLR